MSSDSRCRPPHGSRARENAKGRYYSGLRQVSEGRGRGKFLEHAEYAGELYGTLRATSNEF